MGNFGSVRPLGRTQEVRERRGAAGGSIGTLLAAERKFVFAAVAGKFKASEVLSRISITLLAAVAVVKGVESVLRGVFRTSLARAARGALGRGFVEKGVGAVDGRTCLARRAVRATLAAFRAFCIDKRPQG